MCQYAVFVAINVESAPRWADKCSIMVPMSDDLILFSFIVATTSLFTKNAKTQYSEENADTTVQKRP